jgi:pilus assembly protein CpaF
MTEETEPAPELENIEQLPTSFDQTDDEIIPQAVAAPQDNNPPTALTKMQTDDELPRRMLASHNAAEARSHSLFFDPENDSRDFTSVLTDVQEYVSSKYSALITDGGEDAKTQIKRYITKYIQDHRISVQGLSGKKLVDTLYTEMAEFGFLTKYIFGSGIEEININSWRDVEVLYSTGQLVKLEEHFDSPAHAINVIRRMLHVSGMVLDNASPAVLGHLSKNTRIAVLKTPLVDEDVGITASIRIVNPQSMVKEDFVHGGTATGEMMDFLSECLRYGVSVCIAGSTGSGKTTIAGWLLTTIPHNKRIFTIENGSRELDLVREQAGRVSNSVIHTITRESDNEKQNIDQEILLDMALRFHPDVICVGEMRSAEAYTAQEAARTGHAVLSTVHSNSCEATWRRIVTLCKRKYDMADDTLMDLVSEAFPVIVFVKQLENKERKIMEIMECETLTDGARKYNTLFRYNITENRLEDGKFIIGGRHEVFSSISKGLQKRFLENGMPQDILEKLTGKDVRQHE